MSQHRSAAAHRGASTNARNRRAQSIDDLRAAEVTDIIPFNEFGGLPELDYPTSDAFERESRIIHAPELDDMDETDDQFPIRLAVPSQFLPDTTATDSPARSRRNRESSRAYRASHTDVSDGIDATDIIDMSSRRGGAHRKEPAGAVKSRLMIAAMAAGATAAGAYSLGSGTPAQADDTILASDSTRVDGAAITGSVDGMQIVSVSSTAGSAVHAEEVTKAAAFAQERAEREARLSRPLFVMPTKGYVWTSNFGYRWGVLHAGIDLASPIGTPISAVSDGVVIAAGPTAGYGAWVKLRHADGTVTLYGHINTWVVNVGDRVMAGDQIATVGNRGNSTGPHLHFEVLPDGSSRIDPVPWLAKRGLTVGSYVG